MSREQLEQSLQRLRRELDVIEQGTAPRQERLRTLIDDVEAQLATLEATGDNASLVEDIKRQIVEFEVEHPRITNILNDLMVTLGNLGIR